MQVRRILDVIVDIATLLALTVAGIGHLLPWIDMREEHLQALPLEFQMWHATRSGLALGAAAFFVLVSLAFDCGPKARRLLVVLVFAGVLTAIVFQILIFSPYPITDDHRLAREASWHADDGFLVALVPSIIAGALCLLRMSWTMTNWGNTRRPDSQPSWEPVERSDS